MDRDEIILNVTDKMDKTIESLEKKFTTVRAGRANPSSLDGVMVDYYGSMTPLKQLATISVPEPRSITVQPWDQSMLKQIEKAIMASDLGINPSNDGKLIRLVIPQLTEERRKDLVKVAKKEGENAKVAIRNIRRHAITDMKKKEKDGDITEDDLKNGEKNLQKLTDEHIKKADEKVKEKEKEITTI